MTVRFTCRTQVRAPIERLFDAALSIDVHLASMEASKERAVAGVLSGQIQLGEEVTWKARHFGRSWTMTNRIVELDRPHRFVDEQVRGPFACFRRVHRFEPVGDGTLMIDEVEFHAPFGPLGRLAEYLVLRRYLGDLIERRNQHLVAVAEQGHGDTD